MNLIPRQEQQQELQQQSFFKDLWAELAVKNYQGHFGNLASKQYFSEQVKLWLDNQSFSALMNICCARALAHLKCWRFHSHSSFFKLTSARSRSLYMSATHCLRSFKEEKAMQFSKNNYHIPHLEYKIKCEVEQG